MIRHSPFAAANNMATRYKIVVESNNYKVGTGYRRYSYTVCTCLDERKAIVLVTSAFKEYNPNERILRVISVKVLEGDTALPKDIIDRLEY
jgi:hypothetical protein